MARVRVRQHVNPLCSKYQISIIPPDWTKIYENLTLPLHIDIGCGRGRFLWKMAKIEPHWNFLGLEIRIPLVEEANLWRDQERLTNLHYLFANVNHSITPIFDSLPPGIFQRVSVQFPDPWFKKRHQKRRVIQPELVSQLASYLSRGGEVFLQSDVKEVAEQMVEIFTQNSNFQRTGEGDWLRENPLLIPTEREIATLSRGEPVYRALFIRK